MNADSLICKVCNAKYNVEHASRLDWQNGLTPRHCLQTIAIVTVMCASSAAAWIVIQLVEGPIIRMLAAGTALLIMYVCIRYVNTLVSRKITESVLYGLTEIARFRFLSMNTVVAYQRAKISSLNIVNSDSENSSGTAHVATISHTVSVDLTKSDMATI